MTSQTISAYSYFSAPVYKVDAPEFLNITRKISNDFLKNRKNDVDLNSNYPVYMTENMHNHPNLTDFAKFVGETAWNILDGQGYAMDNLSTYFTEMWCQEHHKGSSIDRHIHNNGAILSGFYFLNCPDSAKVIFHDPRDSKVITSLPEKNPSIATHASNMINFKPVNGNLILSNSWLPHSFEKNTEEIPLTFIHINIAVSANMKIQPNVEII